LRCKQREPAATECIPPEVAARGHANPTCSAWPPRDGRSSTNHNPFCTLARRIRTTLINRCPPGSPELPGLACSQKCTRSIPWSAHGAARPCTSSPSSQTPSRSTESSTTSSRPAQLPLALSPPPSTEHPPPFPPLGDLRPSTQRPAPFAAHHPLRHPVASTVMHLPQSVIQLERDFPCPDRSEFPSQPGSDRRIRLLEL